MVPSIALAAYLEPLVDGRRVVVFGDATSDLSEELLERGARVVHVFDEDPDRAAEAAARRSSRNISVAPLGESDVAVRDGAFDVALVENLAAASDMPRLLKRVRRALSARGAALICSPNPEQSSQLVSGYRQERRSEPFDYYDFYDAVTDEFELVRMLGQTPFVGYAVVEFSPENEPEVTVDSASVPGGAEEPEWFLALVSRRPLELDSFAIIQLPLSSVVANTEDTTARRELREARQQVAALSARLGQAEAENTELKQEAQAAKQDAQAAKQDAQAAKQDAQAAKKKPERDDRVEALRRQLEEREAWIRQLEARASAADARADEALESLEEQRERLERAKTLEKRLVESEHARDELARELDAARQKLDQLSRVAEEDDPQARDYAALEALLIDRSHHIAGIERKLRATEHIGAELVQELEELRAGRGTVAEGDAESLATRNAELEADLVAARWTIEELEHRLDGTGTEQERDPHAKPPQADL